MNDDTLLLYYYDDGLSEQERREVAAALGADPALAARYAALHGQLQALEEAAPPAAPAHLRQQWHDSIDRAARAEHARQQPPARSFSLRSFGWGAAVAAALALGIAIGVYLPGDDSLAPAPDPIAAVTVPAMAPWQAGTFTRGLQVHLRDTRRDLDALPVEATAGRAELVLQIIRQNRIFERAAERNDSRELARVLRAFETILVRLAAADIAPADAEDLRRQLAVELEVMLTILERDASKQTQST